MEEKSDLKHALEDFGRTLSMPADPEDASFMTLLHEAQIKKFRICLDHICSAMENYLEQKTGAGISSRSQLVIKLSETKVLPEELSVRLKDMIDDRDRLVALCSTGHTAEVHTTLSGYHKAMCEISDILGIG